MFYNPFILRKALAGISARAFPFLMGNKISNTHHKCCTYVVPENTKGLQISLKALILLVAKTGVEPVTSGL
jgi:hypothetical protein